MILPPFSTALKFFLQSALHLQVKGRMRIEGRKKFFFILLSLRIDKVKLMFDSVGSDELPLLYVNLTGWQTRLIILNFAKGNLRNTLYVHAHVTTYVHIRILNHYINEIHITVSQ